MISDDPYSVWKKRRSQVDVDRRFADGIMARIGEHDLCELHRVTVVAERRSSRIAWRVQVAAAVLVVGLGVGLIRASSLIVFLLLSTSRGY